MNIPENTLTRVGTIWPALFLACSSAAQVVVDPGGGGQFTDLQTAITAVAPGTVLRVVGGSHGPLVISKSLTIIGDPAPTITPPRSWPTSFQPPAITLQGGGGDRLVLSQVVIQGVASGFAYAEAGAGISGSGFAELHVYDSTVHAPAWTQLTGSEIAAGVPGIAVSGSATVYVSRSDVRGSASESGGGAINFLPDGPPGISAANVIALDSTVIGGDVGDSFFPFGPVAMTPCPCPSGLGYGGPGIAATQVFDAGSTIQGGTGSRVFYSWVGGPPFLLWGQQPDGPATAATQRVQIPTTLWVATPPRVGSVMDLVLWGGPALPGALFLGDVATAPIPFGSGLVFLDPGAIYGVLPLTTGQFLRFQLPRIPPVAAFGGLLLGFQAVFTDGTITNPVTATIVY